MQPQPAGFIARAEFQAGPKIKKDIGDLRDDQLAGFQKRRRERRMFVTPAAHHCKHSIHTTRFAGDIIISGARIFERQPHEFAPSLDFRPIEQLIAHECTV